MPTSIPTKFLLERGADRNIRDRDDENMTPLDLASDNDQLEVESFYLDLLLPLKKGPTQMCHASTHRVSAQMLHGRHNHEEEMWNLPMRILHCALRP